MSVQRPDPHCHPIPTPYSPMPVPYSPMPAPYYQMPVPEFQMSVQLPVMNPFAPYAYGGYSGPMSLIIPMGDRYCCQCVCENDSCKCGCWKCLPR